MTRSVITGGVEPQLTLLSRPGTYVLVMKSVRADVIQVGRLGHMPVSPGWYLYVGSAFGPGGIRSRVLRHYRSGKRWHWHIDYLRAVTELDQVWISYHPQRLENSWGRALHALPGVTVPLPGFGASDSRLPSHLVSMTDSPAVKDFIQALGDTVYPVYHLTRSVHTSH